MAITQEELLKITTWSKEHETILNDLYKKFQEDTGNTKTSFVEFCAGMYYDCRHLLAIMTQGKGDQMKTICCECEEVITPGPDDPVSHGLCLKCFPDFLRRGGCSEEEIKKSMEDMEAEK
jgi:hypothetical protein